MNWNSSEFIWLDWLVLATGVIAIVWAVYRSIKKDKEKMQGADRLSFRKGRTLVHYWCGYFCSEHRFRASCWFGWHRS